MSDLRNNIYLPLTKPKNPTEFEEFYLGELVEKLLLFDKIIVNSQRLNEISYLINHFGLDPTLNLLKSQSILFHDEILRIGSFNIDNAYLIGKCRFEIVTTVPQKHLDANLQRIQESTDLTSSRFKELENYLVPLISNYEDESHVKHFTQFHNDIINNNRTVRQSISNKIRKEKNVTINPDEIIFNIEALSGDHNEYIYDTNIHDFVDITAKIKHNIIINSLLSFDNMNQRFLEMKTYEAISGFREKELNILDEKIKFLLSSVDSEVNQESFRRVFEIADLPDFSNVQPEDIDINELLEIRNSDDLIYFRSWLNEIENSSDEEIREMINSYKIKAGNFLSTKFGKGLVWIISTASDIVAPGLGSSFGIVDSFLLDKVLPNNEAVSFLNNKIPSIFKNNANV